MVFEVYSKYYDLFYREKDYQAEVDFLERVGGFPPPISILDLGCGTGGHVLPLARRGYKVTGVDMSKGMIEQAQKKSAENQIEADFQLGDIRSTDLGSTFDAVLSMFAVMGYQTSNDDLFAVIKVARKHLKPGGLFVFDAWFGPAVLRERPETRMSEFSLGGERIIRIAVPELNTLENKVIVHYTLLRLADNQVVDETHESHPMRFFFAPEIAFFAQQTDFEIQKICPFLSSDRNPTDHDWNVTWILRAV